LWLYSVDDTVVAPGLPGLHALYVGAHWELFGPVRIDDRITSTARLIGVSERETAFAGRTIRQRGEVTFETQGGRLLARCTSEIDRVCRATASARAVYMAIEKHRYVEDELLRIEDIYDAEEIRGELVRYWEDTDSSEAMTPVVKGPLTAEDIITFVCATSPVRTYGAQIRYRMRHPLAEFCDVETGRYDAWERALLDPDVAREFGFPLPHDLGYQRICWLGNLITNWAGDDAQLLRLKVDILRPNFHGDTTFSYGEITDKYKRDNEHLVRADVWCENQRGERTAQGYAEIALLSRS
jgi:acyl dehydratase